MPSDRKQFRRAYEKRQRLLDEERFSAARHVGVLAVGFSLYSIGETSAERLNEFQVFSNEADLICRKATKQGRPIDLYRGLDRRVMNQIFTDPSISDIVLIGHGNLSKLYLDDGDEYDWRDAHRVSTHLKQGVFIQRFCGNTLRNLSVPLATFAMRDHRNIIAAPRQSFQPEIDPSDEALLRPVSDIETLQYDDIKRLFPIQNVDSEESIDPSQWSNSTTAAISCRQLPAPDQLS